jgi:hypothetical protein
MKVLDGEINGFKIDKFNQYGLEVGEDTGDLSSVFSHPKARKQKTKVRLI